MTDIVDRLRRTSKNVFVSDRGSVYRVGSDHLTRNWLAPAKAARVAIGDKAATADPLAWWCLTELLHDQATPKRKKK
jgi:hypothetical protein